MDPNEPANMEPEHPAGRPYRIEGEWLTEAEYARYLRDVGSMSDEDYNDYRAAASDKEA